VFAALMAWSGTRLPRLKKREWLLLLGQATAGSVAYTTLLILGLRYTSSADAGVVIGTLPIVAAGVAIVVLGERPSRSLLIAIAVAAAGVAAITLKPGGGGGSLLGNALVFAAVVCESLFILLNKRLPTAIAPLTLSTLMTGLGLAVAAVPAAAEMPWTISVPSSAFWAIVYYALVPTVGGFLAWYQGAARVSGAEPLCSPRWRRSRRCCLRRSSCARR
jgi:drug/metabolite transporter (DMT)-like permease